MALHRVNTRVMGPDDFVSTFPTQAPEEAASAVSEFGHDDDQPSAGGWQRFVRAVLAFFWRR